MSDGDRAPAGFAALPMYDWPETATAWDRLWDGIRARLAAAGIEAENRLRRPRDPWDAWTDPDLLLGQTCGWPYVSRLAGTVLPLATFDFGLPGAAPGAYYSVLVARGDMAGNASPPRLLREGRVAVNGADSQSGFRVLGCFAGGPLAIPGERRVMTGSHRESIRAVARGEADVAAIDANSWNLAKRHEPAAARLRELERSPAMPGLPLVTAGRFSAQAPAIRRAVGEGVAGLAEAARAELGLRGIAAAGAEDYEPLRAGAFDRVTLV